MEESNRQVCDHCGRPIVRSPRDRDRRPDRRFCSRSCRSAARRTRLNGRLERTICALLSQRDPRGSICPSDAAREAFPADDWRSGMEEIRRAARRLAHDGRIVITQRGVVVDPATMRGPIRIARGPRFGQD